MSNLALNRPTVEQIKNANVATDGNVTQYGGYDGFAEFRWPGTLTIDLEADHQICCIRLLLWDGNGLPNPTGTDRLYYYRLLTSTDLKQWTVLHDSYNRGTKGWQVIKLSKGLPVRYVRVYGIWNSANNGFQVVELEAHDTVPDPPNATVEFETVCHQGDAITEKGDGFPIESDMSRVVNEMEKAISRVDALNQTFFANLFRQLRTQIADVAAIERSMDAIRREITDPVKKELRESNVMSKRYGRWTVWGCLIGGVLGIASIVQNIVLSSAARTPTSQQTNLIDNNIAATSLLNSVATNSSDAVSNVSRATPTNAEPTPTIR